MDTNLTYIRANIYQLSKMQPLGPILRGGNIVLTTYVNNVVNIAILQASVVTFVPLFVGTTLNPVITTDVLLVFQVLGTVTNNNIGLQVNGPLSAQGMYLTLTSPTILALTATQTTLTFTSDYSVAPNSSGLLSAVPYIIVSSAFMTTTPIYTVAVEYSLASTRNPVTATCSNIAINPLMAAELFSDAITGKASTTIAFTRLSDCQIGQVYTYCKAGQGCGTCFGACATGDCLYQTNGGLTCKASGIASTADAQKIPQPYTNLDLLILIVVIVIIVFIVIWLYSYYYR
jgi:hypothetical protein